MPPNIDIARTNSVANGGDCYSTLARKKWWMMVASSYGVTVRAAAQPRRLPRSKSTRTLKVEARAKRSNTPRLTRPRWKGSTDLSRLPLGEALRVRKRRGTHRQSNFFFLLLPAPTHARAEAPLRSAEPFAIVALQLGSGRW
ncbi:hypothetical protein L1887_42564 [Cichorium endivia]|nr:hypothetical protein L1887_42564 [Cichorium endivia]